MNPTKVLLTETNLESLFLVRQKIQKLNEDLRLKEQIICKPVASKLRKAREENEIQAKKLAKQQEELDARIRDSVLETQETIKAEHLQAIYCKPRTSWNNDILEGMIIAYPELEKARKVSETGTVQIREVK